MPFVTVGTENDHDIQLHFEDHGSGRPVVLIHGFPLDGGSWEPQTTALLDAGYRVITYDRRGFGRSSQPTGTYDYDVLADDLEALLAHLGLSEVTLVGFSMGTGEIARYAGRHGTGRLRSAVLLATLGPQFVSSEDDPAGIPHEVFAGIQASIRADRFQYLENYLLQHYVAEQNLGTRVSHPVLAQNFQVAAAASPYATSSCVDCWQEDFRADLPKIDVPLLVMQGTEDRNIPIEFGARRIPEFVPAAEVVEVPGAPHGFTWTHREVVTPELLTFLASK